MINTQEKEIKQEEVLIGEVKVPVIREDGELYYPISFVMSKVLFKKTDQGGYNSPSSLITGTLTSPINISSCLISFSF